MEGSETEMLGFLRKIIRRQKNAKADESPNLAVQDSMGEAVPKRTFPRLKYIAGGLLVFLVLLAIASAIIAVQAKGVISSAGETAGAAKAVYDAAKSQDLISANQKLDEVKTKLAETEKKYSALRWTGFIPLVGSYWHDGNHALKASKSGVEATDILIDAVEPYADVLGFKGQGSFLGGTAEDRIVRVVETLDKVTPKLDEVAQKLTLVSEELGKIDPDRYPFEMKGRNIGETIRLAQTVSNDALFAVTKAKPAMERLPKVMGVEKERKYMVLFQNDAELRSTGGFMTAYAILRIEKGKVFQEKSEDIYALDDKFTTRLPVPEPIQKYLPLVYRFNLRDMNLSPDFKVAMDLFSSHYNTIRGEPKINGIVAVDTKVLKDIVEVLGPIEVPGYGTYSSENDPRCDCPQVVYALELLADKPLATQRENRKGVLAPMLQTILLKSYGAPKQIWPKLFEVIIRDITEKHVLFYFYDPEEQQAAELINVAGRIREFDGDYFHLNDTNFAGAKSNMFTTQETEQAIEVLDGKIIKTVTVKYQNPFPPSNCNLEAGQLCLNGVLRDYVRLYVPKGSKLLEALGSEVPVETKEDLGKTVFEGFFTLRPQGQAKLVFRYEVPYEGKDYRLLIQKQPGSKKAKYTIATPQGREEFDLASDREVTISP
ncbi:MAG: hypothetical protein A2900_03650 [Candidatus Chisholmbacteria bacterium RIFCSPLOWO2_01_FULL_50_28]|nr:MAG: hypothetical protein A2900_03650 [Candidatus Chisholmbacteria bacterium RIFCSPLOWO2_01_FULL_50_28]